MITEREYKYWLTRHCPREFCWVVAARLGEMISHADTKSFDSNRKPIDSISLTHESLEYIYFAVVDNNKLLTLVEDPSGYYLIENDKEEIEQVRDDEQGVAEIADNNITAEITAPNNDTEEDEIKIASSIHYSKTLSGILNTLSRGKQKQLGIKKREKCKIRPSEATILKGPVHIDFINKSHEEKQQLWDTYISKLEGTLDLSGFHTLDVNIIRNSAVVNTRITDIIIYQNINLYELDWLSKFPRVTLLSIWFINMLENNHLTALKSYVKHSLLDTIEIHHCYQVTGRCLIDLLELPLISKIIIDNEQFACQDNPFSTVIKRAEWDKISNNSLEFIMINSCNLTLDFINYIQQRCTSLKKFVMNDIILDKFYKNSHSGHEEEKITFQSCSNTSRGFTRQRDVKVYGLLCSQVDDNVFSTSMLNLIKKKNPERANLVEFMAQDNDNIVLPQPE